MLWNDVLKYPSVVMLTGKRGGGKSATGYYLLQYAHEELGLKCYVKGLPESKAKYLPDFINLIPPHQADLPDEAAIFLDEAAIYYYARDFKNDLNKAIDTLITVSRHKKQLLIFATHFSRKIDVNIITDVDLLGFKQPGLMHTKFERRELRGLVKHVYNEFLKKPEPRQRYTYVISDDYEGFVVNPKPEFFTEELSHAFAGISFQQIVQMKAGRETIRSWDDVAKIL